MHSEARVPLAIPWPTPGHFGHTCTNFYVYACIHGIHACTRKMHHTVKGKTCAAKQCPNRLQTDIFRFRTCRGAGDDARREPLHMSRGVVQRQMTPEHANLKTLSMLNPLPPCFSTVLEPVRGKELQNSKGGEASVTASVRGKSVFPSAL